MIPSSNGQYLSQQQISAYLSGKNSFIPGLTPAMAMEIPTRQILYILEKKLGVQYYTAFNIDMDIASPVRDCRNGAWLKKAKMVGINVRTVGSFWHVVKYMLTIPKAQNSVHLLPIWEPGVVSSLYGVSSWNINPEFFSNELKEAMPHLDTPEKQLKVVVNVLHALGKTVGMDVIPHTDRFSEQVLANPHCFEWLQRLDKQIIKHSNNLHESVQELIFRLLRQRNPSLLPETAGQFFSAQFPESYRLRIMFGETSDYNGRLQRREELVQLLYHYNYETVPATMAPPYRGLEVDEHEDAKTIDEHGRVWRDYVITKPESFSRVFGPLTRYKLYEVGEGNDGWAIDFAKPLVENWVYVARHYEEMQAIYDFDFMRGDMAHVQMRPEGVPAETIEYYDILQYIKESIRKRVPYFGSFAESFLAPAGEMAYGDEIAHLEKSEADTTLGDLQSMEVGSARFMDQFTYYLDVLQHSKVAPNFTLMTADKDDPRFDSFYLKGNEARFFVGLFLMDMPSYMSLGFECRDPHPVAAPNEHYTKLYVFYLSEGPKSREGDYVWGKNMALFETITRMKMYSDGIVGRQWAVGDRQLAVGSLQELESKDVVGNGDGNTIWLLAPDPHGLHKVIAWMRADVADLLFVVNLDCENDAFGVEIPSAFGADLRMTLDFSTKDKVLDDGALKIVKEGYYQLPVIEAGEGRVYRVIMGGEIASNPV